MRSMAECRNSCTSYSATIFCKVMVALWFVWHHRNRVSHGSTSMSPVTAAMRINNLHKDFTRNNKYLLLSINNASLEWQKPAGNFIKINCDGAWNEEQKAGGLGVILRDSKGCILSVMSTFLQNVESAIQCEAAALREVLIVARNLHLENVIFETDNITMVQSFNFGIDNEASRSRRVSGDDRITI
ncbi:hypothetical protein QQ045_023768 [Rhodiola kirilowii]